MNRFVLMRFAEMLAAGTGTGTATLDAMIRDLFSDPGNVGEACLRQNQIAIRRALLDLEARCLPPERQDV